jgi:hypothetical protein
MKFEKLQEKIAKVYDRIKQRVHDTKNNRRHGNEK